MAVEHGGPETMTEYIKHHLVHLEKPVGDGAFWVLHLDSLFFQFALMILFVVLFLSVARRSTSGVPGKLQCFIEIIVEFVDGLVKETFHGRTKFVAPLAITVFCLVFLMNFMDMLPVDLLPAATQQVGISHLRIVPTADLSTTFAMSIGVFFLIQYYGISRKGFGHYLAEFFTAPFHAEGTVSKILLAPVCLIFRFIEEAVRPISLALRLFGNMYAGELIFVLIACMTLGSSLSHASTYIMGSLQLVSGFIWTAFHVLVITLQAFVFMMLTVLYLSIAAEKH